MKLALRLCSEEAGAGLEDCAGALKLKVSTFCVADDVLRPKGVGTAGKAVLVSGATEANDGTAGLSTE